MMETGGKNTRSRSHRGVWILLAVALLISLVTCGSLPNSNPSIRRCEAAGGKWIGAEYGPNPYCALG
jgi:hypothetical protein